MTAYVISEIEILDHEAIDTCRRLAADSIAKYGGRYLVRGGPFELVEGQPETAKEWYNSSTYGVALKVREKALDRRLVCVQGV